MSETFFLKKAGITATSVVLAILLMCIACAPTPPTLSLLDAIDQDNADVVRDHMGSGTDPNKTFIPPGIPFAGASALHVAVLKDNREIFLLLLDNGADIDIRALDDSKGSPLEWAAYFGLKDMAVFLVESGADINARNAYGTTPLDAAYANNPFIPEEDRNRFNANRDLISAYLIEKGAESTAPTLPLLDAIDQDNADAVRAHLESGTNPDKTFIPPGLPFAGASALHLAVLKDNQEIVQVLLDNGADIDIKALDEFKGSPLEWAAFFGIKDMAVFLVESGAGINSKNAYGTTPLDATSSDNPFIPEEDRKQFDENRFFLRQYLSEKGAQSGR